MTDEMLALAQANAAQAGATNVEFLKGHIEALPLPAESIDVVISNCVVNLAADKHAVFAEIARVLRPGGRIGISDIVAEDSLSPEQRAERGSFAGCIAGALSVSEFRDGLEAVGLTDVSITPSHTVTDGMISAIIKATKPADARPLIDLSARREMLPVAEAGGAAAAAAAADADEARRGRRLAGGPRPADRSRPAPRRGGRGLRDGRGRQRGDRLVGCAAIEPYDGTALLRSVAVAPDLRGTGVGTGLVHAVEDLARDRGATSLILLTETAEPWFSRLGYATIDRDGIACRPTSSRPRARRVAMQTVRACDDAPASAGYSRCDDEDLA